MLTLRLGSLLVGVLAVLASACGSTMERPGDGGTDGSSSTDTSVGLDGARDSSPPLDAARDVGLVIDAATDATAADTRSPDAGADAGPLDARVDSESAPDATPDTPTDSRVPDTATSDSAVDAAAPDCRRQDAEQNACTTALCDAEPRWYWNGDTCFSIECGTCTGTDCPYGFASRTECQAAHTGCEAAACRGTGGTWRWWAEDCGHYVCGSPSPAICIVGQPSCDCGVGRSFDPARGGCFTDPACPELVRPPRDILCTSSGGTWEPICCDTVCGAFCPAPCLADACNCGAGRVFDAARGCVEAAECFEPMIGSRCVAGRARCQDNGICCQSCGGAGCFGDPVCRAPTCDSDPFTDICGNRLDVP